MVEVSTVSVFLRQFQNFVFKNQVWRFANAYRKSYNKRHEKYKRRTALMDELRKAGY